MAKFSITEVKTVQKIVNDAVAKALEGTAFAIDATKGTYGDSLAVKITFKHNDPAKQAEGERYDWDQACSLFGLKPEHYGAEFTNNRETYVAVGFELRRQKFPLRAKNKATGKVLLFTQQSIDRIAQMPATH